MYQFKLQSLHLAVLSGVSGNFRVPRGTLTGAAQSCTLELQPVAAVLKLRSSSKQVKDSALYLS